jgi:multiple sugar transport system permease protein
MSIEVNRMRAKKEIGRSLASRLIESAVLLLGATTMLLPFAWMVLSSFKTNAEIMSVPPTPWPSMPTLTHYVKIFTGIPIFSFYANSLLVSSVTTVSMVFTSATMGYVLAKFQFRGKNILFGLILATMMLPFSVTMIPLFLEVSQFKLVDTHMGLILPFLFSAMGIFLMRQSMFSFPQEMREAAIIDGCGEYKILFSIVIPLFKPAMSSLAILVFMNTWDSYLWPLLLMQTKVKYTLPLGLATLNIENITDYGVLMAGAAVSVIPIIIVFLFMQKNFIEALTLSGVKA